MSKTTQQIDEATTAEQAARLLCEELNEANIRRHELCEELAQAQSQLKAQRRRLMDAAEHHDEHHEREAGLQKKLEQVAEQRDQLQRQLCEAIGHVWVEERRGEPVTAFKVCGHCGKIGDRL